MAVRLDGKVAIVTGAGRGIGKGIALALAEAGAKVVVNDLGGARDGSGGESKIADEVVEEIKAAGGEAAANYDSVATVEGGQGIIKTAVDNFGTVDIIVNNAGILRDGMLFKMEEDQWDMVIAVHLRGHYCCTKPAVQLFREKGSGRVINMSSTSGLIGNSGQANYASAKAGIAGLTRSMAPYGTRKGYTVNTVAPTAYTRLTDDLPGADAIKNAAPPEAVAPLIVYLASDEAAHVTGQTFHIGGGRVTLFSPSPLPMASIATPDNSTWEVDALAEAIDANFGELLKLFHPNENPINMANSHGIGYKVTVTKEG